MRVDIMIDIEALGKQSDSTIFQIAAMAFNLETGEIISSFNKKADLSKDKNINVDGDTLVWWLNTNKELLTSLLNEGDVSKEILLVMFKQWIESHFDSKDDNSNVHLWGNGILFDNKMIQYQLEKMDFNYPIHYKNDRDVRTILDLASDKLGVSEKELKDSIESKDLVEHDALDDVKYQIELVCKCHQIIMK